MHTLLTAMLITTFMFVSTTRGLSAVESETSFFSQFKKAFNSAYDDEINAAHFKTALVDAVVLSRMITIYYVENGDFPASLDDINHSGFTSQGAVAVKMLENGSFHVQLSDIFGADKFIAMEPVMENNEIPTWTRRSNVSARVMEGTACLPVE